MNLQHRIQPNKKKKRLVLDQSNFMKWNVYTSTCACIEFHTDVSRGLTHSEASDFISENQKEKRKKPQLHSLPVKH